MRRNDDTLSHDCREQRISSVGEIEAGDFAPDGQGQIAGERETVDTRGIHRHIDVGARGGNSSSHRPKNQGQPHVGAMLQREPHGVDQIGRHCPRYYAISLRLGER